MSATLSQWLIEDTSYLSAKEKVIRRAKRRSWLLSNGGVEHFDWETKFCQFHDYYWVRRKETLILMKLSV